MQKKAISVSARQAARSAGAVAGVYMSQNKHNAVNSMLSTTFELTLKANKTSFEPQELTQNLRELTQNPKVNN